MKNCPRCGLQTKTVGTSLICGCGWNSASKKEGSQKSIVFGLFLSFTLSAGLLFHFFEWGSHALDIVFADSTEKVKICMDLKKYDCVEKAYQAGFDKTGDINILVELGELQFKRERFKEAKDTYALYFSKDGKDYKAAYYYAHSLVKAGDIDLAIKYFDSILQSNTSVLMVTVTESYLEVLISNNRLRKAQEVLAWVNQKNKGSVNTADQIQVWRKKFNI